MLLDHDSIAIRALLFSLEVRSEKEFFEDLTNEILLANNAITDTLVSFGNDLACQRDQTDQETLLLSC